MEWKFCYVGLHPTTRTGVIVFVDKRGNLREIPLKSWPRNGRAARVEVDIKPSLDQPQLKQIMEGAKAKQDRREKEAKAVRERV